MNLREPRRQATGPVPARARWALFGISLLLVSWPFVVITFPPLTDLPQHAAQVRLLGEALAGDGPYAVQWATPYGLAYAPLGAAMAVAGPLHGARLGAALIALLWVAAVHLLAWRLGRSAAAATAASVLVFHHALYWGFLPFLIGFPVFAGWVLLVRRPPRGGFGEAAVFAAGAVLLYLAHALWFAAGLGWLALASVAELRRGAGPARLAGRLVAPGLVAAGAAAWFASLSSTTFATPPLWMPESWRRLLPGSWVEAAFGGLKGWLEPVAFATLVAWLVTAVAVTLRRRGTADEDGEAPGPDPHLGWERSLLVLGLLFVAGALLLPDKFTNTIEFNDRWMPPGLALLLLAAPSLPLRSAVRRGLAITLLASFVMVSAVTWQTVESEELAGLAAALAALPEEPRLLGLDFPRDSAYLDRVPFLQSFAWSQVTRGGELNFSFADFPTSLVVYEPPRPLTWTPGLEWFPRRVRSGDFGWFSHALVRAPQGLHRQLVGREILQPLTPPAPWVLYRVTPAAEATPVVPPPQPPP